MKWLAMMLLSSVGLASGNEGIRLMPKFPGSDRVFVYGFALHQAIDKLQVAIIQDIHNDAEIRFGVLCQFAFDPNEKIGLTHCLTDPSTGYVSGRASAALIRAFKKSLRGSDRLKREIGGTLNALLAGTAYDPEDDTTQEAQQEALNKRVACAIRSSSKRDLRRYWNRFSTNYTAEFGDFADPARRKTLRLYFEAVSRTYGMYAARMKKISRQIELEYDCDGDGGT